MPPRSPIYGPQLPPSQDGNDPLDALAQLLGGDGQSDPSTAYVDPRIGAVPQQPTNIMRNQALSGAIAKKYGIPGAADGSASQTDLQALDDYMRGHDVADKVAEESVAPNISGQYGLQHQQLANQGSANVATINERGQTERQNAQGQWEIEKAKIDAQGRTDAAKAKQPEIGPDGLPVNNKPLDAVEGREARGLRQAMTLAETLQTLLDPSKDQIPDKLSVMGKWMAYKSGFSTDPAEQQRMNLAGLLKVVGSSPYVAGSRNFQYLKQVQDHLTDPTMTDKRLYDSIEELKAVWPEMLHNIILSHRTPGAALSSGPVTLPGQGGGSAGGADLGAGWRR